MDSHGWSADLGLGVGANVIAQDAPRNQTARHLNLLAAVVELGNADFGIAADADEVGVVELHLDAAAGGDGNRIASH